MAKKKKKQAKRGKRRGGATNAPVFVGRVKMPNKRNGEIFGRIVDIYGNDRMQVFCADEEHRVGRIRGKIKKRVWIRRGDLVIISPWDWETPVSGKMGKCEITWRYLRHEVSWLERNGRVPDILNINNISF